MKDYFDYIIELNDENADIDSVFGELNDMEVRPFTPFYVIYRNVYSRVPPQQAAKLVRHLVAIAQELDMPHTKWVIYRPCLCYL